MTDASPTRGKANALVQIPLEERLTMKVKARVFVSSVKGYAIGVLKSHHVGGKDFPFDDSIHVRAHLHERDQQEGTRLRVQLRGYDVLGAQQRAVVRSGQ